MNEKEVTEMDIMENLSNERRIEIEDLIEYQARVDNLHRQDKEDEQEQKEKTLTIKHFLSIRLIMEKIDFQKLFHDHLDALIKFQFESSRTRSKFQRIRKYQSFIKKIGYDDEFIIKTIVINILDLCEKNQFKLGLLNKRPHYFNNHCYVEINKMLMKELLSDISKRNGVKNYDDYHFINSLYARFIDKLIPFSTTGKSYKEKGWKLTIMPKRIVTHADCYFTRIVLKPSVE